MSYPIQNTTTPPPGILAGETGALPSTVGTPGLLSNVRSRAISNATFVLNTSTTTPSGENKVMQLHRIQASSVLVILEAAAGAVPGTVLARFWQDGSHPSTTNGLHLKDGGVVEIIGAENVTNFRIVTADDRPHRIQVQYFQ